MPSTAIEITNDIERTRDRMGDTLEELGGRLNPDRIKQRAKRKVRDAAVRTWPISFALIAGVVGLVIWKARRD
jgi:hypothetical protein